MGLSPNREPFLDCLQEATSKPTSFLGGPKILRHTHIQTRQPKHPEQTSIFRAGNGMSYTQTPRLGLPAYDEANLPRGKITATWVRTPWTMVQSESLGQNT